MMQDRRCFASYILLHILSAIKTAVKRTGKYQLNHYSNELCISNALPKIEYIQ